MNITEFKSYTCDGDTITWTRDGFDITARILRDDNEERPDERDEGFWPSLDPNSAGYIGPKSKTTLRRHTKRAEATMAAWEAGDWWYVGVCVTVSFDEVPLTGMYDNACWGIECNYPKSNNKFLGEMARDLATGAIADAKLKLFNLKEKV